MIDNSKKKELFLQTLTKAYNHQEYVRFLQELLNDVQIVAPTRFNKEFSSLSGIIAGHYHIGNYKGADGKKMALFAVQLQNKGNVENARSSQRAFIKTLLDNSGCDGALAAFFTMEKDTNGQERPSDKWRLSLIRMEYGFADGKLSTKLTPAKRYSYLVGKGEPCHTAQERLYGIFAQDEVNPGLAELEEAFSVETVTKQFFNDYKEKYLAVKEYLEATPDFMAEAERCGFTSEQFTKKLMGQIVFLYFIQKKGWLGVSAFPTRLTEKEYKSALFRNAKAHNIVERVYSQPNADGISFINREALFALSDEDAKFLSTLVKGKSWGEGPKNFMRALYESCVKQGRNYFDDYLEPLFYEALNVDRGESGFYARFHCRVPFLNGGLFEQLDNYDWINSDFHIPNSMFSNADENDKDEADGILDIFDRYNFTMAEDEPMEREVAIDPEMLGKVFENLLDVKDRKSKGAFYTPREIVHYMCQESLINYLTTNTDIEETDIRKFILYGEYFRDNDCLKTKEVIKNGKKSHTVDKTRDLEMPESIFSFKQGANRLQELDELLANVKIADPAVGSGAFLLGLLNEIVRARQTLTAYMTIEMNGFERFNFYAYGRKAYDLKVNTIKNCLFACDLEPSATDITKLRLWLSIVIDDELVKQDNSEGMYDAHTEPRPLPNLDCNIICGNSLMDEFEGIKLITESSILNNQAKTGMDSFYQAGFDNMLQELIKLQDELYFTKQHETKQNIKKKIHAIYDRIILHQLESNPLAVEKYKEVKDIAQQPFILWQLYFPKVFKEKHGFDIVIGNPPYVQIQKGIVNKDSYPFSEGKDKGKQNLYKLFIEKGYNLVKNGGNVCLIVQSSLLCDLSSMYTRELLLDYTTIKQIIEFPKKSQDRNGQVFDSVLQGTCICQFIKNIPHNNWLFMISVGNNSKTISNLSFESIKQNSIKDIYPESFYFPLIRVGEFEIMEKINANSQKLKSYIKSISQGDLNLTGAKSNFSTTVTEISLLRGRNIARYYVHNDSHEYVLSGYLSHKVNDNQNNVYLVGQEITGTVDEWRLHYALTDKRYKFLFGHTANKILLKNQELNYYILGIINSSVEDWFYRKTSTNNHVMGYEIKQLPIPYASEESIAEISTMVKKVIDLSQNGTSTESIEREIDNKIYQLYHLTQDEINVVAHVKRRNEIG